MRKKIVVFDTGTGGRLFADHLRQALGSSAEIITAIDTKHAPYGNRTPSEIFVLTLATIAPFIGEVDAIVLACNTATAICIDRLRAMYRSQFFVGFEPMIKPASIMSQNGKIAVLATHATISSDRYKMLKDTYARNITVLEPDVSTWATKIDTGTISDTDIVASLTHVIEQNPDVVTLSCTHYIAIEPQIQKLFKKSKIIHPFPNVTAYIKLKLNL